MLERMENLLTIGQLSQRSGVATSALRFYEERGLLQARRTGSGHRRFHRSALRRIAFIVFGQRVGLSLEEIGRELAQLPENAVPTHEDWAALSARWVQCVDARIAELQRLREGLTRCIGCGCLSLEICQIINAGDRLAAFGPGPVSWVRGRPDDQAGSEVEHRPGSEGAGEV